MKSNLNQSRIWKYDKQLTLKSYHIPFWNIACARRTKTRTTTSEYRQSILSNSPVFWEEKINQLFDGMHGCGDKVLPVIKLRQEFTFIKSVSL